MIVKRIYKAGMWGVIGSLCATVVFYLRFRNPLLREELILYMQKGDTSYWSMFIILNISFLTFYLMAGYVYNKYIEKIGRLKRKREAGA